MKKKKIKMKVVCIIIIALLLCLISTVIYRYFFKSPIGNISGVENDIITIDGVIYESNYNNDYSIKDRGDYLGKVETKDSQLQYRVYSVKGTDEFIYGFLAWEGTLYKRIEK